MCVDGSVRAGSTGHTHHLLPVESLQTCCLHLSLAHLIQLLSMELQ